MPLTNQEIDARVRTLVAAALEESPPLKPERIPVLNGTVDLIVNLLQNINEIAATARGRLP